MNTYKILIKRKFQLLEIQDALKTKKNYMNDYM